MQKAKPTLQTLRERSPEAELRETETEPSTEKQLLVESSSQEIRLHWPSALPRPGPFVDFGDTPSSAFPTPATFSDPLPSSSVAPSHGHSLPGPTPSGTKSNTHPTLSPVLSGVQPKRATQPGRTPEGEDWPDAMDSPIVGYGRVKGLPREGMPPSVSPETTEVHNPSGAPQRGAEHTGGTVLETNVQGRSGNKKESEKVDTGDKAGRFPPPPPPPVSRLLITGVPLCSREWHDKVWSRWYHWVVAWWERNKSYPPPPLWEEKTAKEDAAEKSETKAESVEETQDVHGGNPYSLEQWRKCCAFWWNYMNQAYFWSQAAAVPAPNVELSAAWVSQLYDPSEH